MTALLVRYHARVIKWVVNGDDGLRRDSRSFEDLV